MIIITGVCQLAYFDMQLNMGLFFDPPSSITCLFVYLPICSLSPLLGCMTVLRPLDSGIIRTMHGLTVNCQVGLMSTLGGDNLTAC